MGWIIYILGILVFIYLLVDLVKRLGKYCHGDTWKEHVDVSYLLLLLLAPLSWLGAFSIFFALALDGDCGYFKEWMWPKFKFRKFWDFVDKITVG